MYMCNKNKWKKSWQTGDLYMYCGGGMNYYYKLTSLTHIYFFSI